MADFPQQVQTYLAPGVLGDFSSANPRFSVVVGAQAFVAGAALFVGRFCWADYTNHSLTSSGSGPVTGFMGRNQQGLITTFLASSTLQVLSGIQVFAYSGGDFWVVNNGVNITTVGMKAYANFATGNVSFAATGTPPDGGNVTGNIAAAATTNVAAAIAGNVLTTNGNVTGTLVPGGTLSGTGVQGGTVLISQLSGNTTSGTGTWAVNPPQTVANTTITEAYGVFTISAANSGSVGVGDVLTATAGNVTAGTTIISLGNSTGGVGTVYVSPSQANANVTVNTTNSIETKWVCMDPGRAVGELVRISDHPLG